MFFILSKILSFLVDPFFWILSLFILSLLVKEKFKRKSYFISGLILILFFSNGLLFKIINEKWNIDFNMVEKKYDYGILMGGMISLNSTPENIHFLKNNDRLLNTIELYKKGIIEKIIISGASGSMSSEMKEASLLKYFLVDIGIPNEKIIIEEKSKNTYENALFCSGMLNKMHPNKNTEVLIITSNYHMRRSVACFNKMNIKTDPYVKKTTKNHFDLEQIIIPQSNILFNWKVLLHEIIGYYTYMLVGYI